MRDGHRFQHKEFPAVYEILFLRSKGWTINKIAIRFQRARKTIEYHCAKYGVVVGTQMFTLDEFRKIVGTKQQFSPLEIQHLREDLILLGYDDSLTYSANEMKEKLEVRNPGKMYCEYYHKNDWLQSKLRERGVEAYKRTLDKPQEERRVHRVI